MAVGFEYMRYRASCEGGLVRTQVAMSRREQRRASYSYDREDMPDWLRWLGLHTPGFNGAYRGLIVWYRFVEELR